MIKLPDKEESLVRPGVTKAIYPNLKKDIEVDTAIVGGGIAGLTVAYLLKKAGQKVAVIEKDTIGSGTTGHTTGKVTSQHNLVYADLKERLGTARAKVYGQANQTAIAEIEKIIKAEKIDCGWERADNYVYTAQRDRLRQFKDEAKAAAHLGLPASFQTTSPLPFKITAAVKFTGQAHFSAQKYINGLAKAVNGRGSYVFEKTQATSFQDGRPATVGGADGEVAAQNIIVATTIPTLPLAARATYALLEYPNSSYLVAGKPKIKLSGMYISPDDDHYSLLPVGKGAKQILLVGGQNHIPGLGRAKHRQRILADYAQKHFGVKEIDYRWHARDYMAYDGVPLIGKLYPWSKYMYVITGFKKWGLSHSMVAGMILRDTILGQPNPWVDTFNSQRLRPILSIPHAIGDSFR